MSKKVNDLIDKIFPEYIERKKKEDDFSEEFEPLVKEIFTDGFKAHYRYTKMIIGRDKHKFRGRSNKRSTYIKNWFNFI